MKVCLVQLAARAGETQAARLEAVGELLTHIQADLIILPELWPSGGFAYDRFQLEAAPLNGPAVEVLAAAARKTGAWIVGGSLLERSDAGTLHNTAIAIDPGGELVASYRKAHLFGIDSGERALLTPGSTLTVVELPSACLGLSVCYDLRFPELYRVLASGGAEILVVVAAWWEARRPHWELLLQARAVENQAFVLGCNSVGLDGGFQLAGASMIVGPSGDVIARAGESKQELLYGELDLDAVRTLRREFPVLEHRRLEIEAVLDAI
jgi:predicted amidohydrolase